MQPHPSFKSQVIEDLYDLFKIKFRSGNYEVKIAAMNGILDHHGLHFRKIVDIEIPFFVKDIEDVEESFYDCLNERICNDLPTFATICSAFIDFEARAKAEIEKGNFNSDNLLFAIAGICKCYNNSLKQAF